jgi:hypothetical protein
MKKSVANCGELLLNLWASEVEDDSKGFVRDDPV